jgi:hypothetical protein
MSSSTDLNLTGVREEIAVAVAEAMRKQQAMFQCQNAGVIAKQGFGPCFGPKRQSGRIH